MRKKKLFNQTDKDFKCIFPCPHNSSCCHDGVTINENEMQLIKYKFGKEYFIWDENEKEYRTKTKNKKCIFLIENKCIIHKESFYPEICREYPLKQGDGEGPYQFEIVCPEWLITPSC